MGKVFFVTGGVCSGIGKGLVASSIGSLLEMHGHQVSLIKIDPYLNVDAGTMSPYQHGEVFVTEDGTETDLDLGNYSRFTHSSINGNHSITAGKIYDRVVQQERKGLFLGQTVQVIPHMTNEIKNCIYRLQTKDNIVIIEVGGTVGDIESIPFIETVRQVVREQGHNHALVMHVTPLISINSGELKTKPIQHSVKILQGAGIQPDFLICRAAQSLNEDIIAKLALFTNVDRQHIFASTDVDISYQIPWVFKKQGLDQQILQHLQLEEGHHTFNNLSPKQLEKKWETIAMHIEHPKKKVKIGLLGKYIQFEDSYKSILEALIHAGLEHQAQINLIPIDCESSSKIVNLVDQVQGLLAPMGFGNRGSEGIIAGIHHARIQNIPFLGICFGFQHMLIEYARYQLGLENANSTEIDPNTPDPVVALLEQQDLGSLGGTMRLGSHKIHLVPNSQLSQIYQSTLIEERHRHRWEFNQKYKQAFQDHGLILSGFSQLQMGDLNISILEAIQWPNHPWGFGVQFHPEFISTPLVRHPLFSSFIEYSLKKSGLYD